MSRPRWTSFKRAVRCVQPGGHVNGQKSHDHGRDSVLSDRPEIAVQVDGTLRAPERTLHLIHRWPGFGANHRTVDVQAAVDVLQAGGQ
ncbi:hypothetical protein ES708_31532 [subsurface metagenome]